MAGIAACGSSSSSSSGGSSNTTAKSVTIWASNVEFWAYQAAHLQQFTKETGIKVNYVQIPQATILDKETIAQRAHSSSFDMYEGPTSLISQDIGLLGGVGLKSFESNSKLNVTGFSTNGMGELGDCTLNGTLYCLPVFVDGSVIAYNKKLFTQAGISTPPATWAQVVTDADQITQKTGTPGWCTRGSEAGGAIATAHFMEAYYIPYNAKNKGFTVGPDWKSLDDSPGALAWAKDFQHLMTKDAPKGVGAFTQENCEQAFDQGKTAMYYDALTSMDANEFTPKAGSPLAGAVGFDELKCPTSNPCMPLGPWGMFINPRVPKDQQNAAWKLMQYLDSTPFLTQEIKALDFPGLAVTKTVASEHFAGVPDSFLQAEAYVESQAEPNAFPPTTAFNQSQQDEETAISELISGTPVKKAAEFAANGANQVFQQAGLTK
ncbi:MAG TPA: extracellular solute-binding protein [Streptosporangiaceae bacterium]|nr:extracellular solute-binding protein [Streptosporangiaceae bacterium]